MQNSPSFTPLRQLLSNRSKAEWHHYWSFCRPSSPNSLQNRFSFMDLVATLIDCIQKNNPQRALLISSDRFSFLAGFLATLHANVLLVLPPADTPGLLKDIMKPGDIILSDQKELALLGNPFISLCPVAISPETGSSEAALTQEEILFPPLDPLHSSITFYTSGSTGHPKSILKTLEQLETEIETLDTLWGEKKTDHFHEATDFERGLFLSTVPHYHIYGLLFSLLWPVCAGYPLHCKTYSYWEELLPHLTSKTYLLSSPAHLERFPLLSDAKVPLCHRLFSSGGPLSYEAAQKASQILGCLPYEVYGSTETGGIAFRQQVNAQTPWTPFPKIRVWENNHQQLCLTSPYLPTAYETQDQVDLFDDGTFLLKGRLDRIAKVEGKRVSLTQIERLLLHHSFVQEAVALHFPKSPTYHRDTIAVVIVLTPDGKKHLSQHGKLSLSQCLSQHLKQTIEPVLLPKKWRFVDHLPTNAQGKRPLALLQNLFHS